MTTVTAIARWGKTEVKVRVNEVENGRVFVTALCGEPFAFPSHGGWDTRSSVIVPVCALKDIRVNGIPAAVWRFMQILEKVSEVVA
jgi:hypothetical protein